MQSYPKPLRLAVLRESRAGASTCQVAKEFKCSRSWVRRVKQQCRELGKYGPYKTRLRNRYTGSLEERVRHVILDHPSITVDELRRVFQTELPDRLLYDIREQLFIKDHIYWHGAEGSIRVNGIILLSQDIIRDYMRRRPQEVHRMFVYELIKWRPDITVEELTRILGTPPMPGAIYAAQERIKRERVVAARARQQKRQSYFGSHFEPKRCN